ncbi:hypothetical protein L1857_31310 [Amycolatopsis thermalba]|uniref:Uncharacterized protein n=1 Tax=Amycolatopsis thermalba TaxID=944492 RepID=A0ABY4P3U9_9PSEU|nr:MULTISPECIES: hypothetical protein [Amycolatopsis]UQS26969.1 hypothetical protein L1857_31310 [Amycolatopsis thermalba]
MRTVEYVDNRHTHDHEQVLWDLADTMSRTGALIFREASYGLVLGPEHTQLLAKNGMSKQDVQRWVSGAVLPVDGGGPHRAGFPSRSAEAAKS